MHDRARRCGNRIEPGAAGRDQHLRLLRPTGRLAEFAQIVEYLFKRFRRQPKDLWRARQQVQHSRHLGSRRRANLAEILCQDQVGGDIAKQCLIHLIQTEAAFRRNPISDIGGIDFLLGHAFDRQNTTDHNRLTGNLGWVIAIRGGDTEQTVTLRSSAQAILVAEGEKRETICMTNGHRGQANVSRRAASLSRAIR